MDMEAENKLSAEEKTILLKLAREALEHVVRGSQLPALDLRLYPPRLSLPGASFVTLRRGGELRGCIGGLHACQPLAEDVRQHAAAAATQDYRFPRLSPHELDEVSIEISVLTEPRPLEYTSPQELLERLRPGIDGVVLQYGVNRATFLPQVWESISDPAEFLSMLCRKMGAHPDLWCTHRLTVLTYEVDEFKEGASGG